MTGSAEAVWRTRYLPIDLAGHTGPALSLGRPGFAKLGKQVGECPGAGRRRC
jgi:hypothetical protein